MDAAESQMTNKTVHFENADLEIRAQLGDNSVTIDVLKSGSCVHRLTIDDAVGHIEHCWIADLFAREDRVSLKDLNCDAEDYVRQLDINQG